MYACMHVCMYVYIHARAHARTRARTHARTHAHTHHYHIIYTITFSSISPIQTTSPVQVCVCECVCARARTRGQRYVCVFVRDRAAASRGCLLHTDIHIEPWGLIPVDCSPGPAGHLCGPLCVRPETRRLGDAQTQGHAGIKQTKRTILEFNINFWGLLKGDAKHLSLSIRRTVPAHTHSFCLMRAYARSSRAGARARARETETTGSLSGRAAPREVFGMEVYGRVR